MLRARTITGYWLLVFESNVGTPWLRSLEFVAWFIVELPQVAGHELVRITGLYDQILLIERFVDGTQGFLGGLQSISAPV